MKFYSPCSKCSNDSYIRIKNYIKISFTTMSSVNSLITPFYLTFGCPKLPVFTFLRHPRQFLLRGTLCSRYLEWLQHWAFIQCHFPRSIPLSTLFKNAPPPFPRIRYLPRFIFLRNTNHCLPYLINTMRHEVLSVIFSAVSTAPRIVSYTLLTLKKYTLING